MSALPSIGSLNVHLDTILYTLLAALGTSVLVVLTNRWHGRFSMDHPGAVQKFHLNPTPRIGGIGIFFSLVAAWWLLPVSEARQMLGWIVVAGLPAFSFGVIEDLTKRVSVRARLLATMGSGALVCLLSGQALSRLDVPLLDDLLTFWPIGVMFTAFAVGGVANAINIVDGFHGLASGTSILSFSALGLLALLTGDISIATIAFLAAASIAGFWLVNYPWGKLFLGDGGAYFTGFAMAWLAVLLPARNPEVSPWACLLICGYPIIEVVYSIFRRMSQRLSPGAADSAHLHSLLAKQLVNKRFSTLPHFLKNAAVAPFLWLYVCGLIVAGLTYRHSTGWLVAAFCVAAYLYHLAYKALSRPPVVSATSAALKVRDISH